jgi:c-di-GMP-binding flagellar brake protein YcgR
LLEPPVKSVIGDINIGGIFLKANPQVEFIKDDQLAIVLSDVSGDTEMTSKVLRVQTSPEGKIGGYGCCFLFLNARQEEVIARFIHNLQIERRKEEKEEENADAE